MQHPESQALPPHPSSAHISHIFDTDITQSLKQESPPERLTIKLPPMTAGDVPSRRPGRNLNRRGSVMTQNSPPSGSEYHESERSMMDEDPPAPEPEDEPKEEIAWARSHRGRRVKKNNYREPASEEDIHGELHDEEDHAVNGKVASGIDDDDDDEQPRRLARHRRLPKSNDLNGFIASDDDNDNESPRYGLRTRRRPPPPTTSSGRITRQPKRFTPSAAGPPRRLTRARSRAAAENDDGYVDEPSEGSDDAEGSLDDAPRTSSDLEADVDAEGEPDIDGEGEPDLDVQDDGRPYALRQRAKINYAIPPPLEEMKTIPKSRPARGGTRSKRGPGWSASGAELSRWMGMPADDSDSDIPTRTPRKGFGGASELFGAGAVGAGGASLLPGDLAAAAGTPSNLGKIGDSALADADPLGVNQNVTFDEVGGLDDHIHSLKEMTLLPLLYPEVFQRFNLTPPRGVLFHGPPGTGKTLLARALAASCRANGKGISFFMRKGADCLSKWVGEAERQLRLLFEEARNCQPSIIFFDEIDGLAPVRSSKQDQIHASIVSTLLALMDGMDGRGQVIIIGATNRPDAIDPALRRPGRFDREFYFPLPSLEAREKILGIMTRNWEGWSGEQGKENVNGLAKLTKGYGGADLRALCTEAALNAIQRRYPQIYQSNDRLLLKPETIGIALRDFMISLKKLVASSARSSSSAASPLPSQLESLLADTLHKVKEAINRVLPVSKKRSALEEAQWEDESEEGALEREMLMQSMETLRVYRPRLALHGQPGMGQGYIGAAALHHLEGYHIQNLDLGTLMGDSTRTVEAGIVQLFVEAKRHQPSVIYIPSLLEWSAAVSETSRSTVRAMLDSLAPTDPILLLAIVDGPFSSLPSDVRSWFGLTRENRLTLPSPTDDQREAFFTSIIADVRRPPNQFADGMKRKRRILEELPVAPPPEPRQPTAAELAVQAENDQKLVTLLKYRLGPILTELKRKFKRFTKRATQEYEYDFEAPVAAVTEVEIVSTNVTIRDDNAVVEITQEKVTQETQNEAVNGVHTEGQPSEPAPQLQAQAQLQLQPPPQPQAPPLHDMDLERMHMDLYRGKYLTPQDFLDDIHKIVHNANVRAQQDIERLHKAQAMLTAAEVSVHEFDPQFRLECQRMAERERKRRMERKKAKGKNPAESGQNGTYAPGTRRSARHTGQQPEMAITDPLQLERRLKRARSGDRASGSPESGEDIRQDGAAPLRQPKRLRTVLSDDDDHDPIDLIGPPTSSQQVRVTIVRFANDEQPAQAESSAAPEPQQLAVQHPVGASSDAMAIDSPAPRRTGFDPFLLNPLPPQEDKMRSTPFPPLLNGVASGSSIHTPVFSPLLQQHDELQPPTQSLPARSPPQTPVPFSQPLPGADLLPIVPLREPTRSPTPLPDFHVDEELLSNLQYQLKTRTSQLSVEQLEQLRATCLGCIWRHRAEWNRDALVDELLDILNECLDDFSAGVESTPTSPSNLAY
ncbi:AAA-domain-containing protein [Gyrodon lividus]|nr:AAA-domain-containing protein [Gyrodon lividus]